MRKINVGVSVSPPNVVHTSPYVAKALGLFAKRCIDANIIQFDGGAAGDVGHRRGARHGDRRDLTEVAIAQGLKGSRSGVSRRACRRPMSSAEASRPRPTSRASGCRAAGGGIGGFNWLMGREVLQDRAGSTRRGCAVHLAGHGGRLPGLVAGQIDGVALHPEDVYLAQKQKPGTHVLVSSPI